jgi:peptidoglycan/xylan/chitin deacetylase (PgdA/CDA1 family)
MLIEEGRIGRALKDAKPSLRKEFVRRLPILTYHHVGSPKPNVYPLLTVSPYRFERQIRWLARHGYSSISTNDWVAWLTERRPIPGKSVLITFDDGYEDLIQYALPVLSRYGLKGVVYVVTDLLGKVNEWDQRAGWGELRLMTQDQIIESAAKGIEFGSHTRSHPDLRTLSHNELEDELFGSADDLRKILGIAPTSFAYPYGHFNRTVSEFAALVYITSVTVVEGICSQNDDLNLMPRIWIRPDEGLSRFAQRVKFARIFTLRQRAAIRTRLSKFLGVVRRSRGT